ncbi:hypothetical protein D3C75_405250 [compost metagenome]
MHSNVNCPSVVASCLHATDTPSPCLQTQGLGLRQFRRGYDLEVNVSEAGNQAMQDPFKMGVLTSLLRRSVPCKYWALGKLAPLPRLIRFLFVRPAFCLGLPSDSQSPATPLPLANTSPCRVCRGLSPPSHQRDHHSRAGCACAQRTLPGARIKNPGGCQGLIQSI